MVAELTAGDTARDIETLLLANEEVAATLQ